MNKEPQRYYEFGPFRLSVTDRLLMRSDQVVPLTPKLVDTLLVLVENSERVVTKDKLMETLWPDSFVEESSLSQNISLLRKALGENGAAPQFIETIPKRGYRFIANVREIAGGNGSGAELVLHERTSTQLVIEEDEVSDSPDQTHPAQAIAPRLFSQRSNSQWRVALIAGVALLLSAALVWAYRHRTANAAYAPKSIAVLPFKTIGPRAETELMGLGMADALIIKLSRLEGISVLPTSAVFRYSTREKDALSIARDLGVEAVLDGTVQREGDRIRVTAQLIKASDGTTIWSDKFDDSYTDLFALEDSISAKMTEAVGKRLGDARVTTASRCSTNPEAQISYLTGLYFWNRRTKENLSKAIDYFERAVQKDPNFAVAHALLADSYYLGSQDTYELYSRDESLKRAKASVTRALELDDSLAEAHTVKAAVLWNEMNFTEADHEFRRALELNPNYAVGHLRYGYFLFGAEKLDQALNETRQAQNLDPVSPVTNSAHAFMLTMARDFDASIAFNKKALELQSDVTAARLNLGLNYMEKGMFNEAIAEFDKVTKSDPLASTICKIKALGWAGKTAEARQMLDEFLSVKGNQQLSYYDAAVLYASVGEKEKAFESLEKILVMRWNAARLRYDPELDPLRADPRFNELQKRFENSETEASPKPN